MFWNSFHFTFCKYRNSNLFAKVRKNIAIISLFIIIFFFFAMPSAWRTTYENITCSYYNIILVYIQKFAYPTITDDDVTCFQIYKIYYYIRWIPRGFDYLITLHIDGQIKIDFYLIDKILIDNNILLRLLRLVVILIIGTTRLYGEYDKIAHGFFWKNHTKKKGSEKSLI